MKSKTIDLKHIFIALLLCALAALSFVFAFGAYAEDGEPEIPDYEFSYDVNDGTKISGITVNVQNDITVEIPSNVTQIGNYAFTGETRIKSVVLNKGLRAIGDFALAGTGITSLVLPDSVERIGAAAFADCSSLVNVTLSTKLNEVGMRAFGNLPNAYFILPDGFDFGLSVGEDAFDENVMMIVSDVQMLIDARSSELEKWFVGDTHGGTFPVTIEYMFAGTLLDTETRLWYKPYSYVQDAQGVWGNRDGEQLGTTVTGEKIWYVSNDISAKQADLDYVNKALKTALDKITLYSFPEAGQSVYVARDDLVYDGKAYGMNELNPLLAGASTPVTSTDNVEITEFVGFDGSTVIPTGEDGRQVVRDAGIYTISVNDATLTVKVARKVVDLGAYSNLNFKLTKAGETNIVGGAELINADGYTLYLYTKQNGVVVPSENILSADDAAALGVDANNYTTELVRYSVVRNRGTNVEIDAVNAAYTTSYEDNCNVGKDIGKYTTVATLTADKNYELTCGTVSDGKARNITVTVDADGRCAVVTKVWYIVDVGNYFVGNGDLDYAIGTHVYGDNTAFAVPVLAYGDVNSSDYGKENDPVTLTLYYGDSAIPVGGENNSFTRDEFSYYLASGAMPAGNYRLVLNVKATSHEETGEDGIELRTVYHNAFTHTVRFTVDKRTLLESELDKIHNVLKGKTFTYVWDGDSHMFDADAKAIIDKVLYDNSIVNRSNSVWSGIEYDGYYGSLELSYNLMRLQSDVYYTSDSLEVMTASPDKYIVYYSVGAMNFYSSIEKLESGAARTDYYFNVVNVMHVAIPVIKDKTYTGSALTADVFGNNVYEVTVNNGGTAAGVYDVVLKFYKPDFYMWEGQTISGKTAEIKLTFRINKAVNAWTVKPNIVGWEVGSYSDKDNAVEGESAFGVAHIVITDGNDNVVFDSISGVNKLKSLGVGMYNLTATVEGTDNYNELVYSVFVRVFDKPGLPWWAILLIVVGALLVVAIVLLILWKKNIIRILTDKLALSIRTRATIDATIAAVRASKMAEESKKSVAAAKRKEAAAARKAAAEAEKNKSAEERAAALEAKAQAAAERVEKMRAKAEAMRAMAERARAELMTEPEAAAVSDDKKSVTEKTTETTTEE